MKINYFKSFSSTHWNIIREDTQLKTPIFNVSKRQARLPGDEPHGEFYIIKPPDWINIIATTAKGDVILVEQYRHGTQEVTLEIPGGMVDAGETPLEASKRELREETGFTSNEWVDLGRVDVNPAIQTNKTFTFWAKHCELTHEQALDTHEFINVHRLKEQDFLAHVANGTITHSLVVAAVAKYLLYR